MKVDRYNYLIKKCDTSIFEIFRITKCNKVISLQSATGCYYKVRQVLPNVTVITK